MVKELNRCGRCQQHYECLSGVSVGGLLVEACNVAGVAVEEASVAQVLGGLIAVSQNGSEYNYVVAEAWNKLARLTPGDELNEVRMEQIDQGIRLVGSVNESGLVDLGILAAENDGVRVIWPKGGGVLASEFHEGGIHPNEVVCFVIQAARGITYGTQGDHVDPNDIVRKNYGKLFRGNEGLGGWTREVVQPKANSRLSGGDGRNDVQEGSGKNGGKSKKKTSKKK